MPPSLRPLIVGNWKMNGLRDAAVALAGGLAARAAASPPGCGIVVCPPATLLSAVGESLRGGDVALGAQDCHPAPSGAHTGDVGAPMLADAGCRFVIVGHSERRADHGETDALIRRKAEAARAHGLVPIVCVGETGEERDAGRTLEVVARQLAGSLPADAAGDDAVVAYEPVWAIGTGRTPAPADVAAVHAAIRTALDERGASGVRLLYGGSVNDRNAAEILAVDEVNGALVGGASLDADRFWAICRSCPQGRGPAG